MPAQYTHQLLAERIFGDLPAAVRAEITDRAAYFIGAQGGDVFYFLRVPDGKAKNLGKYMHREDVYGFFSALCRRAKGGAALSYALGYVAHYAADVVFHPFVYAVCGQMAKEDALRRVRLHAYVESDLDSYFVQKYAGVPVNGYAYPVAKREPDARALYELIRGACRDRGRKDFSFRAFRRALSRFYLFERLFRDTTLRKRKFLHAAETLLHAPHTLSVLCRRAEADGRCLNRSRAVWHNPSDLSFASDEDADMLFARAAAEGGAPCVRVLRVRALGRGASRRRFRQRAFDGHKRPARPPEAAKGAKKAARFGKGGRAINPSCSLARGAPSRYTGSGGGRCRGFTIPT